jgi:hypothetical protein
MGQLVQPHRVVGVGDQRSENLLGLFPRDVDVQVHSLENTLYSQGGFDCIGSRVETRRIQGLWFMVYGLWFMFMV